MVWRLGCLLLVSALVMGAGCASYRSSSSPAVVSGECAAQFRWWRANSVRAGTFDAQDWSPPGFPYLRVDRFLASYRFSGLSREQQEHWLQLALDRAVIAWEQEAEGEYEQMRKGNG